MSVIQELCQLLGLAAEIIRKQAELLEMHGIHTENGELEADRIKVLDSI